MDDSRITRPQPDEYDSFYAAYVLAVPEGDVFRSFDTQEETLARLLGRMSEADSSYRYTAGKWSIKEVLGHMADTERVFAYRALTMARGDQQSLPGMDQDDFMAGSRYADRTLADILEEFRAVRAASLALLRSFDEITLARTGTASGCSFTVRSLVYIIAGHAAHHLRVLEERYGI